VVEPRFWHRGRKRAEACGIPLAAAVTGGGNRNDVTQRISLVEAVPPIRGNRGQPRRRPERVYARLPTYSYVVLGAGRYHRSPRSTTPAIPAWLRIAYPGEISRRKALVKWWSLAIAYYLVVAVFPGGFHLGWTWSSPALGAAGRRLRRPDDRQVFAVAAGPRRPRAGEGGAAAR